MCTTWIGTAEGAMAERDDKAHWSDWALFHASYHGDPDAFGHLVLRLLHAWQKLQGLCRSRGIPKELINSVSVDIMMDSMKRGQAKVMSGMFHLVGRGFRRWERENRGLIPGRPSMEPDRLEIPKQDRKQKKRLARLANEYLSWLEGDQQEILTRVLAGGADVDEAGSEMGLDPEHAFSLYAEALRRLEQYIEVHGESADPDGMGQP
jgi:hypothetical protein